MTELISVNKSDYVLDPACGTGAFLISAINRMHGQAENEDERRDIKLHRFYGIEISTEAIYYRDYKHDPSRGRKK